MNIIYLKFICQDCCYLSDVFHNSNARMNAQTCTHTWMHTCVRTHECTQVYARLNAHVYARNATLNARVWSFVCLCSSCMLFVHLVSCLGLWPTGEPRMRSFCYGCALANQFDLTNQCCWLSYHAVSHVRSIEGNWNTHVISIISDLSVRDCIGSRPYGCFEQLASVAKVAAWQCYQFDIWSICSGRRITVPDRWTNTLWCQIGKQLGLIRLLERKVGYSPNVFDVRRRLGMVGGDDSDWR